jgi:succinate dehydrogenase/fumarate reductase flavoprotein subunit
VDVVVLGTGAAGLTAATLAADGGAEVLVLEKAAMVGGTTGVSGGMPWVPCNTHLADVDETDSREEALAYIRRLTTATWDRSRRARSTRCRSTMARSAPTAARSSTATPGSGAGTVR